MEDPDPRDRGLESDVKDDTSHGVGTQLYMSPELFAVNGRLDEDYDQSKRDLYAIGIVLFEMWSKFDTVYERVTSIQKLTFNGDFPTGFRDAQRRAGRDNVVPLIRMLVEHDYHKRPSAVGVLESNLLPDTLEDSKIKWVVRNLRENDYFHARLLDVLFSRDDGRASILYDPDRILLARPDTAVLHLVQDTCSRVCRRHAAHLHRVPLLTPAGLARPGDTVLLMDKHGCQYDLPTDLTQSFAHYLARGSRQRPLRRFAFGNVFRARPFAACKESAEAAFDIVCAGVCTDDQRRMEEAEVLSALIEFLLEVPLEKQVLNPEAWDAHGGILW